MDSYIIDSNKKKSRIPARLDFAQSGTGLILGLFMWVHMLLVGSIILGKGSFNFVAKNMELAFLSDTGHGYPIAVFFAVFTIFTLFIIHAMLGVRKFPISWKQHRILRDQMQMMNHTDTNLWYIQVITGFLLFFTGSVHLYIMLTNPGSIGPYMSADRIVSGNMWPLYMVLLVCVELHAGIGLYRLCMKWGWFTGKDAGKSRETLKLWKNRLTIFFLTIGVLALFIFIVIGINHRDKVGEKYSKHSTEAEAVISDETDHAEAEGKAEGAADESGEPGETKEAEAVPETEDTPETEAVPETEETPETEAVSGTQEDHGTEAGNETEADNAGSDDHSAKEEHPADTTHE